MVVRGEAQRREMYGWDGCMYYDGEGRLSCRRFDCRLAFGGGGGGCCRMQADCGCG